ncbi:SIMPL domain-containing protein [Haloferula sargassicola]|uniref:SIMPL domain-containing protein n=1 Tax=Haloferula sargassicola TaxID=490096 RepID=A0ABP9UK30_9BACT
MMSLIPHVVFAALLLSASIDPLRAQDKEAGMQRRISVTGTVEFKTPPDEIVWNIRLVDENPHLATAKESNDGKISAVLALQETLEIDAGNLETGHLNIEREYERGAHGERGDFKYFRVSRQVVIRQQDLTRFDEYLDALVSSAEIEANFQFESSKMQDLRAEARLKAMGIAKEKASGMAEAVGAKVGRVLTINEHSEGELPNRAFTNNSMSFDSAPIIDRSSGTMIPGALSTKVTVYVSFELE